MPLGVLYLAERLSHRDLLRLSPFQWMICPCQLGQVVATKIFSKTQECLTDLSNFFEDSGMSYRLVKFFLRFRNVLQTCGMSYRLVKKRMSCRLVECLTDLPKKECPTDLWNVLQTCQKKNVLQTCGMSYRLAKKGMSYRLVSLKFSR